MSHEDDSWCNRSGYSRQCWVRGNQSDHYKPLYRECHCE